MWTVRTLSIAPVKSLGLHHPDEIALRTTGAPADRLFFLLGADGRLFTGAQFGPLVAVRADYDAEADRLSLSFPDGTSVQGDATPVGDEVVTVNFYGRPVRGNLLAGPFGDALSDYTGSPIRIVRVASPGDASDVHHVTVVSSSSVAELARRGGREGEDLDARRFRMMIEIDGTDPHQEDAWESRRLRVGDAVLRMHGPVPRCVVTTQDPATGLGDFPTLKTIAAYRPLMNDDEGPGIPFGVYAEVDLPGRVRVGDVVSLER